MSKNFILILFILTTSVLSAEQWRKAVSGSWPALEDIYFIDENTGFAVGGAGTILKTTDAGMTWVSKTSNTRQVLNEIYFLNSLIGYAAGDDRTFLKTIDGGETWSSYSVEVIPEPKADIKRVYFANESNGWIIGSFTGKGWILHTSDGGANWILDYTHNDILYDLSFFEGRGIVTGKKVEDIFYSDDGLNWSKSVVRVNWPGDVIYTNRSDIYTLFMIDRNIVFAEGCGFPGQPSIHLKSSDGGVTWTYVEQDSVYRTYGNLVDNYFIDDLNGIAVGSDAKGSLLTRTTDGGLSWKKVHIPFGVSIKAISKSGNKLFICGQGGLIAFSNDFGNTWSLITPTLNSSLRCIQFTSSQIGFAGGYDGNFLRTSDGGTSWISSFLDNGSTVDNINDLFFINNYIGYSVHENRSVSKTTDGGLSWNVVIADTSEYKAAAKSVYFFNEHFGYVVGLSGDNRDTVFKTTDGGATWSGKGGLLLQSLNCVRFSDESNGIIVGNNLTALYTKDGGDNWYQPVFNNAPSGTNLKSVAYSGKDIAYAVGDKGIVLRTTDGGAAWDYLDLGISQGLNSICFHDPLTGYAVGKNNILKTTDAGYNWTNIIEPNVTNTLYDVDTDEDGFVWVSADSGIIYTNKYETSNITSLENITDFKVAQNYPNPFNPCTQINYAIPEAGIVEIKIFDILGREVASLFNGIQKAGNHFVAFNAHNLTSGTYIYRVKYNSSIHTGKMILMK